MLTPFETTGVKTTRAQGETFLAELAATTPVVLTNWGTSVEGNPMTAATIGSGPIRVAISAGVHGNEPGGREGAFKHLRDLAETTDPAILAYLASNAWTFMCTGNPDRIDANVRENANGADLNRDFHTQLQPETQAMGAWLNAADPVMIMDLHEAGDTSAVPDTAIALSEHPDVLAMPSLVAQSAALAEAIELALVAAGNGVVPYPYDNTTPGTLATEGSRIWKASALTFETQRNGPGKTLAARATEQVIALRAGRADHAAHAAEYIAAQQAAGGVTPPPDPDPPTQSQDYRIHLNGVTTQAAMLRLRVDGRTTTIWTPVP